jgi:hypothetical protein
MALFCALPARPLASSTQETVIQDDVQLIYSSPARVAQHLQEIASLGIDRIRVSVVWSLVAPNADSARRPQFNAKDPAAYPAGAWDRYDTIVHLAAQLGIRVDFQLSPPAPAWAVDSSDGTQGYSWSRDPSAALYRDFVTAVGLRYSGTYVAKVPRSEPQLGVLGILPVLGSQPATPGTSEVIPRVDYWEIWNEPNEASWLNPVARQVGRRQILVAPVLYRGLAAAAGSALASTGHGGDTILFGETASFAPIEPAAFVQAMYCLNSADRPLRGQQAKDLSCSPSGDPSQFLAQHPELFTFTGYAHHPYQFDVPPSAAPGRPTDVTLSDLPSFERALDGVFRAYGRLPRGGMPIYLSEWGYKTDPPNPFVKTSTAQQAVWLNQGEYMAWRDPRVRLLGQFLLVDDGPRTSAPVGSRKYWGTFQTGLLYLDGRPKPAYASFRIPIWLPNARHGPRVTVWGQLRPADHATYQWARLEFRPQGSRKWRPVRSIQTANPEGFLLAHVSIPGRGSVRLDWFGPAGAVYSSRTVAVR